MRYLFLALLCTLCIIVPSTAYEAGTLGVTFVDVGQADAIIVQAPNGEAMLVDAGTAALAQSVIDALADAGVSRLAYAVATHSHDDHIGGMESVLATVTVGECLTNGFPAPNAETAELGAYLAGRGVPVRAVTAGDTIPLDPGNVTVTVLNPPPSPDASDENEASVVLRLVFGSQAFLLMGDAGITAEDRILASGRPVSAQVLKVGHHGGSTTTGSPFVSAVDPSVAVVTANRTLTYLPSLSVIQRLQDSGSDVYSTASSGTVMVAATRTGYRLETGLGPEYPIAFPGESSPPTDPDYDAAFEDANGNRRIDFADVVLVFNHLDWIAANEPPVWFDYNGNGRIDFADVVWLFGAL